MPINCGTRVAGAGARRKNEEEPQQRNGAGLLASFRRRWREAGLYLGKNVSPDFEYGVVAAAGYDRQAGWWPPDDRYI